MNDAITIDNVLEPLRLYLSVMEQRITDLEGASPCSPASPAPSDGASASSGGTTLNPSTATGAGSSAVPSHPKSADAATVSSDPSAAIRADPAKQYGRCPICGEWGANRERRINGNDQCPKGHSYPSSTAVYHVPTPQPEKAKPAAASAWEEFWRAQGVDDAKDREAMHYGDFNRFVAAREKAAGGSAFPITAKAGRCAACRDTILDMGVRTGGEWYHNACAPKPDAGRAEGGKRWMCGCPCFGPDDTHADGCEARRAPKPRRAPEVVAREVVAEWYKTDVGKGLTDGPLMKLIAAAVRADRGEV